MNKVKILTAITRVLAAILLILLAIFLYGNRSAGWFSSNEEVKGTGMEVKMNGVHLSGISEITYKRIHAGKEDTSPEAKDSLFPGDQLILSFTFTTVKIDPQEAGTAKFNVDLSINAPSADYDHPVVDNGKYYYLSSQVKVVTVTLKDGDQVLKTLSPEKTLSEAAWGGKTEMKNPPASVSVGIVSLNPEKTYTVEVTLEYINAPNYNQSILRGNPYDNPVTPSSFNRYFVVTEEY